MRNTLHWLVLIFTSGSHNNVPLWPVIGKPQEPLPEKQVCLCATPALLQLLSRQLKAAGGWASQFPERRDSSDGQSWLQDSRQRCQTLLHTAQWSKAAPPKLPSFTLSFTPGQTTPPASPNSIHFLWGAHPLKFFHLIICFLEGPHSSPKIFSIPNEDFRVRNEHFFNV